MVEGLIAMHLERYADNGVELVMGEARLTGPRIVEVALNEGGMRTLRADTLVLNVGTHATIPQIPGLADAAPLTHIEALDLDRLPAHLVILGGGYVGLEFAQAYRRFGSRVTVIEQGAQLLSREDLDVAEEIRRILEAEGVEVLLQTGLVSVRGRSGEKVQVLVRTPRGERTFDASDILVAAGRTPNTAGIGLEAAGVELDQRGYIRVDERLRTTAEGVWAIGECAGSAQFTHVSFDDFRVVRDNLAGVDRTTTGRLVPYCLFTDPPLARVGMSEVEAGARGIDVRVVKMDTAAVLRTRTTSERAGFLKALVGKDDRIVGFAMIGADAGEVMAVMQTAMLSHLPYTGLRDAIFTHPTMAEGLNALFAAVPPAVTAGSPA
jgi:pyruvate/2-oxoglutarate dehydrogenase complex dihydrolipoamide dehydrogenase (E3) component